MIVLTEKLPTRLSPLVPPVTFSTFATLVVPVAAPLKNEFANPTAFRLICRILGFTLEDAEAFWTRGNPGTNHGARYLTAEAELLTA